MTNDINEAIKLFTEEMTRGIRLSLEIIGFDKADHPRLMISVASALIADASKELDIKTEDAIEAVAELVEEMQSTEKQDCK